MANKVTLDFENNTVIWDTNSQRGTEFCPDLSERRPQILAAMGYETVSFSPVVDAINAFINGEIDGEELVRRGKDFEQEGIK